MNIPMPSLSAAAYFGTPRDADRFEPVVTIHEDLDAYDIEAELPGSSRADVHVFPHRRTIEIVCDHAVDHDDPPSRPHVFGPFATRVRFSDVIDVARVESHLRHGVLHIHAPKRAA